MRRVPLWQVLAALALGLGVAHHWLPVPGQWAVVGCVPVTTEKPNAACLLFNTRHGHFKLETVRD